MHHSRAALCSHGTSRATPVRTIIISIQIIFRSSLYNCNIICNHCCLQSCVYSIMDDLVNSMEASIRERLINDFPKDFFAKYLDLSYIYIRK